MIAYHGTRAVPDILQNGLQPRSRIGGCKHVCLAARAALAANFGTVLRVDITGLELQFEHGEARSHDPISRDRIRPLGYNPDPSFNGWRDPAWRGNHGACLDR